MLSVYTYRWLQAPTVMLLGLSFQQRALSLIGETWAVGGFGLAIFVSFCQIVPR